MSGIWGKNIRYSIFGESHGKGIGMVIDGLPPGIPLDLEEIHFQMSRRVPGKSPISTARKERDQFEIFSGYYNNRTTGAPLCVTIANTHQNSKDYEDLKQIIRPGHADYTAYMKYCGFHDDRGGGYFSGRLTAPLVFAGAIAKQILQSRNVVVGSHIYSIGSLQDIPFSPVDVGKDLLFELKKKDFPVIENEMAEKMKRMILEVKEEGDSIGGIVEGAAVNLPEGLGDPFFDSVESQLSHLLFSIPGVKGVEFGAGFTLAILKGSEAKDEFYIEDEKIKTYTNNNGGILGGITNGMPLIFRVAFKPTPSISKKQRTVNLSTRQNIDLEIEGRHDPCIVPRAVPVVEAVTAMGILDMLLGNGKKI